MDQLFTAHQIIIQLLLLSTAFVQGQQSNQFQNYPGSQNPVNGQFVPVLFPNANPNQNRNFVPNYNNNNNNNNGNNGQPNAGFNSFDNYPRAVTAAVRCLNGAGSGICAGSTLQPVNAPPIESNRFAGGPVYQSEQQAQFQPQFQDQNQPFAQPFNAQPFDAQPFNAQPQIGSNAGLIDSTGVRPPVNMHYYPMSAVQLKQQFSVLMCVVLVGLLLFIR